MSVVVITGSAGLIGSEACLFLGSLGFHIVGIDNDMRKIFFGSDGSTAWNLARLRAALGAQYEHRTADIRDRAAIAELFAHYGRHIEAVIHTAAQPSHDWAAKDPLTDFDINAVGTLNLLEASRAHCPEATFIFTSTNKVYGDTPNSLPLIELESRYEIDPSHTYVNGIREDMTLDRSLHSVFGASKIAADIMVQEYGRYFGLRTACFRGGTLTGPSHSGAELHGFLAYLIRCAVTGTPYIVHGYKGKQVRDAIHSADLIAAFFAVMKQPACAEVYNIGGGRFSNCSVLEAIAMAESVSGQPMQWSYSDKNRVGDHIWWISDNSRFQEQYPSWELHHDLRSIVEDIYASNSERWQAVV